MPEKASGSGVISTFTTCVTGDGPAGAVELTALIEVSACRRKAMLTATKAALTTSAKPPRTQNVARLCRGGAAVSTGAGASISTVLEVGRRATIVAAAFRS